MTVRNALLGLLASAPRHGYELRAAFEALAGGEVAWDVKPAQIYTTLARLEEGGLVAQESVSQASGPEKRTYALTAAGRTELIGWLKSGVTADYQKDEFFIKLMLCLVSGVLDPYQVIQAQRRRLFQEMHDTTLRRDRVDPIRELAQVFLLDKAIMHLEADLRWIDMLEARLDDIRQHPPPGPLVKPRGRPKNRTAAA
jgi:DNA-binding PadR family transcriptional regulator